MLHTCKVYRFNEFAKRIGRTTRAVGRWEREGKLTAKRLPTGHRYFDESDVRAMLGGAPEKRFTIVYCHVSSARQRFKRKYFLSLIELIQRGEIERILIAHKDRLVRFGFDLLDHLSREHDREIVVVNQESLSPEQEMVEDLLAIVHTFSCRLYGMRNYKKQIREDFPASKEPKDLWQ